MRRAGLVLLIVTLLGSEAAAQKGRGAKLTPDERRAFAVVEAILKDSAGIEEDMLRLRVRSRAADLLWGIDASRARRLFEETFRAIETAENKMRRTLVTSAPRLADSLKFELRQDLLRFASTRDEGMAEALVGSVAKARVLSDQELAEHNLQIALVIAESNPRRSARLAKESLSLAIGTLFPRVVHAIRQKNAALADDIFSYALSAARRDSAHLSWNILLLSYYVFPEMNRSLYSRPETAAAVSSTAILQFIDFVYDMLMRQPVEMLAREENFGMWSADYFYIVRNRLPIMEKQDAERVIELRARIDEILKRMREDVGESVTERHDENLKEILVKNPQELITKAEAAGDQKERDDLYSEAAYVLAVREDRLDQALALIERIGRSKAREEAALFILGMTIQEALRAGDADKAYRYASAIKDIDGQARAFTIIARYLANNGDADRAVKIADEAARLVMHTVNSKTRAETLTAMAAICAQSDAARGFEIAHAAADAINQAGDSIIWDINETSLPMPGIHHLEVERAYSLLGRADFNKAIALAQTIKMKDSSLIAQLAACRAKVRSKK
jgi:hypothetical protein